MFKLTTIMSPFNFPEQMSSIHWVYCELQLGKVVVFNHNAEI